MSSLPPGFKIDSTPPSALPAGFEVEAPSTTAKPFSIEDTWPVQLAKGLWNAFTLPGRVYQGKTAVPSSWNNGANIGETVNFAGATPVSDVTTPMRAIAPTLQQIKTAAKNAYRAATSLPMELKSAPIGNFAKALESALNSEGWDQITAPSTIAKVRNMQSPPEGSVLTPQNLHSVQKSFGMVRDEASNKAADRAAAGIALNHFNNFLENLAPQDMAKGTPSQAQQFLSLIRNGNGNYTSYKIGSALEHRMNSAELNAASAHSGANIENALRQQFRQILKNPKLQRGYNQDQLQAMDNFVRGSGLENIARAGGNLLGGGGGLGMIAAGTLGHIMGLPAEALPMVGLALKQYGNKRAMSEASRIGAMVRSASPLARSGFKSFTPRNPVALYGINSAQRLLPQYGLPPVLQFTQQGFPYYQK